MARESNAASHFRHRFAFLVYATLEYLDSRLSFPKVLVTIDAIVVKIQNAFLAFRSSEAPRHHSLVDSTWNARHSIVAGSTWCTPCPAVSCTCTCCAPLASNSSGAFKIQKWGFCILFPNLRGGVFENGRDWVSTRRDPHDGSHARVRVLRDLREKTLQSLNLAAFCVCVCGERERERELLRRARALKNPNEKQTLS